MLQRAVGASTAASLVLFGEVLDGEAAERCGLAWRCVDDDALLDEARAMAARVAAAPPALARRVKATMKAMPAIPSHDAAVDLETEAQVWSTTQPEFAERLAALRSRIGTR